VQVRAITEAAMNGEIDFKKAFKKAYGFALKDLRRGTANSC
jgi:phosphoserine phosphatase